MGLNFQQFLAIEWVLFGLCLAITIARLAVRTWRGIWSFWLSDLFLVVSVLFFLPLVVGDTYTYASGRTFQDVPYNESFAKWTFASTLIFDLGFYFARFSLLAFYNELFPISEARSRVLLWIVLIFNVAGFLTTALVDLLWCGANVSQNWSSDESACSVSGDPVSAYVVWPINVASEVLVFLLPFSILKRLNNLPRKEKISLIFIFLLGFATVLASVARFVLGVKELFTLEAYLLGSVETATQIIVVALPALRPLLGVISLKRVNISRYKFSSRSHSFSSRGRSHQKLSGTATSLNTGVSDHHPVSPAAGRDEESGHELRAYTGKPPWEEVKLPKYLSGN